MASLFRSLLRFLKAKARRSKLPVLDLSEDLLWEILLRIGSPADLIRASAACVTFRRLIADPCFLRRYRSIHPPLLLGFLGNRSICSGTSGFQPVEPPHPNAPVARALPRASHFRLDSYLPARRNHWDYCDACDGRVLVDCIRELHGEFNFLDVELAVCDPLSRRWLLLPPIPDDLVASVQVQGRNIVRFWPFWTLLVPCSDDETLFRVIAVTNCVTKLVVFVFSSDSGSWSFGTSRNWVDLNVPHDISMMRRHKPQRAHGFFFWRVNSTKLLKLDTAMMEFSTDNLPPVHHYDLHFVIVEAGEDRLALFSQNSDNTFLNYYTTVQNKNKSYEWQMMNVIPKPVPYDDFAICGGAEGYIFLVGFPKSRYTLDGGVCFSLEVKTLKIERVSNMKLKYYYLLPFIGYPPAMSPRVI
ncbi:unnamed protein product [Urochloa decumbens]|uniref:F-box domain-containing protein n=1 Tax=Urochloa decumbens TaxID=240449 RepID=A0ABC9FWM3_9POAL